MDAAGFVFSVPANVSGTVAFGHQVHFARQFDRDSGNAAAQLKFLNHHLEKWKRSVGITADDEVEEGYDEELESPDIWDMVQDHLENFQWYNLDVARRLSKLGVERPARTKTSSGKLEPGARFHSRPGGDRPKSPLPSAKGISWGFGRDKLVWNGLEKMKEIVEALYEIVPLKDSQSSKDSEEKAGSNFEDIIRTWIWQLIRRTPSVIGSIWEHMNSRDIGRGTVASQTDVWKIWTGLLSKSPGCVIVIDGFDEFNESYRRQSQFLRKIKEAATQTKTSVLVTSRNEGDIREDLLSPSQDASSIITLECLVSKELVRADLDRLASAEINRRLGGKSDEVKQELSSRLAEKSDGMFLWIKQQNLDQLRPTKNTNQLRQIVEKMPRTLMDTYMRTWRDIESRADDDRERTLAMLRLVAFSFRPLTVTEITEALLVTLHATSLNIDDWPDEINEEYIKSEIKGLCGSLIDVRASGDDDPPGSRTLHLAHASVKEFLLHKLCTIAEEGDPEASKLEEHHTELAKLCLQYVCYPEVWQPALLPEDRRIPCTFRDYASEFWEKHALQAKQDDEMVLDLQKVLLDADNSTFYSWTAVRIDNDPRIQPHLKDGVKEFRPGNPLNMALDLGLVQAAEWLVSTKPDLVCRRTHNNATPLHTACSKGHLAIVKRLLKNGALKDDNTAPQNTPLNYAAMNGHEDVVACLIDFGTNINLPDLSGSTALRHACDYKHTQIALLLLEQGADPTIIGNDNTSPLYAACRIGNLTLLSRLLEKGAGKTTALARNDGSTPLYLCAELNHSNFASILLENGAKEAIHMKYQGFTPLHMAATKGHIEMLQILLDHGADSNATDKSGRTALHDASSVEAVKLLLKNGANVEAMDNEHSTPFHAAAFACRHDISGHLLDIGANWKGRKDGGWTILHFSAGAGFLDIVQRLVDAGADPNVTTDTGVTPMMQAAANGRLSVIEYLIKLGAKNVASRSGWLPVHDATNSGHLDAVKLLLDREPSSLNAKSEQGETILWLAVKESRSAVAEYLLNRGADVTIAEKSGWTPLHSAAEWNRMEMVRSLVGHGADVNAKGGSGFTPLRFAVTRGNVDVAAYLLEHGADSSEFLDGLGLLHVAAQNNFLEMVKLLLKYRIDLDIKSLGGWTPLACSARNGHQDVTVFLLAQGANLSIQDAGGWDPLTGAASNGHVSVVELLLKHGAEVSAQANDGWTALRAAAQNGHADIVDLLLNRGADTEKRDNEGCTALRCSAAKGHSDIVARLLKHGADATSLCSKGYLPLHASYDHVETIKILLDHGIDVNAKDPDGWTVLRWAIREGAYEAVVYLLSRGADAVTACSNGYAPLHAAASVNRARIIQALLDHGVDIETKDPTGWTALRWAASQGRYEATVYLLSRGANASTTCSSGFTPLHSATDHKHTNIIQALLDHGVDIEEKAPDGWGALSFATSVSSYESVVYLLSRGAKTSTASSSGWTPLHIAADKSLQITEVLLDHGADVEAKSADGKNALCCAVKAERLDIVEYLLKRGADLASTCNEGLTSLHTATTRGYHDIVKCLVDHGADMELDNNRSGMSALYVAAYYGHIDIASFLIDRGASLTAELRSGYTPIHGAAWGNQLEMVKLLTNHGAEFKSPGKISPLHAAASGGYIGVAEYLLDMGVDVQVEYKQGFTPLHEASQEKQTEMIVFLLDHGADISSKQHDGRQPLHIAADHGHVGVMDVLLARGASVSAKDYYEWTPLDVAAERNHEEAVRRLLEHGADPNVINHDGRNALYFATASGSTACFKLLLDSVADFDALMTSSPWSPFNHAARAGLNEILQILLDRRPPNSYFKPDFEGRSALHMAALSGNVSTFDLLVSSGFNPTAKDPRGRTVLHYAAASSSVDLVQRILQLPCSAELIQQESSFTPLHWAARAGNPLLIATLKSAGIQETAVKTNFPKKSTYWTPWALAEFFQNAKLLSETDYPLELREPPSGVSAGKEYYNFNCDSCETDIIGPRFICYECNFLDYCFMCREGADVLHPNHEFCRIAVESS
ncbi:hypothetical protein SLS56_003282 [Neofusicoccum ribis]|uniref:Peptidase A2 domain-containing protein n=1 Tax=Neofusicoccum ribis TaxID=45134 RepID=A0ABR3T081_9PEZI